MRTPLALAALAALSLLAPPAGAAPTAQVLDAGVVDLVVPTTDGDYDVRLLAGSSGGQVLLDVLAAPHGEPLQRYGGPLPSSALASSSDEASLRTELAGQPLTVTWRTGSGYGRGLVVVVGQAEGEGSDAEGWHAAGRLVDVTVRLGDATCVLDGLLGSAVAYRTADYRRSLAALPALDVTGACRSFAT